MTSTTIPEPAIERSKAPKSSRHRSGLSIYGLKFFSGISATVPFLALIAVLLVLLSEALPAIKVNGWSFLTSTNWRPGGTYALPVKTAGVLHPQGSSFGAWPLIVGTVESSFIAIVIAIPVSIGAALIVVKKLPPLWSKGIGFFLETLAGIPSVVYGLWGALTLGPTLSRDIYPIIARNIPNVFPLRFLRGDVGNGEGLLTSGMVLAVMVIPIIAATARDLIRQVPTLTEEGGTAMGLTDWETTRKIVLPWVSTGIIGASVLGLARALGETMAVAMISGSILGALPSNIYSTYTTIAASIVSQLDSALSDGTGFYVRTLAEAGLVLMLITLLTNIGARLLVKRVAGTALPVGRGI